MDRTGRNVASGHVGCRETEPVRVALGVAAGAGWSALTVGAPTVSPGPAGAKAHVDGVDDVFAQVGLEDG